MGQKAETVAIYNAEDKIYNEIIKLTKKTENNINNQNI